MKFTCSLSLLLLLFLVSPSIGQRTTLSGKVSEVIHGDTLIFETSSAKFTVKLQFVDAPESSQSLYIVVTNHLSGLALHKRGQLHLRSLSSGTVRGKVVIEGVDLSLQLLRDGAVWYSVPEAALQEPSERSQYLEVEKQAKEEKRGVWGETNLQPAYKLREEREAAYREKLKKEREEWAKSAAALFRFDEPVIGMSYFSFETLCSPAESGDRTHTFDDGGVPLISKSLIWTDKRVTSKCYGTFRFNRRLRLATISRSSVVE